ncbi:MAG: efflux RND transporter periplasmic adaptor subunit [Pirellulaceae bacterium]|nr:efflux RND transporter periplasmic adaptor subunit [Pirellulaceae bacterium]
MRLLVKLLIGLLVLAGIGWAGYSPTMNYWRERNRPQFETSQIIRGDARRVITSTGKIEPVLKVSVGAFVSGPITELYVDFNHEVKKGDMLAKVDPMLYQAAVDRDQALLITRQAEVNRVQAQLLLAKNNLQRGERLREKNQKYLSDREFDALRAEFNALEASLKVAEASVKQAEAQLKNSQTNLDYCDITSPVDGVILERKIDPGQTLASQFQTPVLFIVAPDLREKLFVYASVDESDIGLIRQAAELKLPVTFNVDAYPGELFQGTIEQIRFSATEVQNVITYPVVVSAANPELKLLPSMTAQISFEVDSQDNVLKIPNAALRYYPENPRLVRQQDRKLLDGSQWAGRRRSERSEEANQEPPTLSAQEKAESQQKDSRRHVWVERDGILQAIEVQVGFSDSRYTVVTSGDVQEGTPLVTGIKKPT